MGELGLCSPLPEIISLFITTLEAQGVWWSRSTQVVLSQPCLTVQCCAGDPQPQRMPLWSRIYQLHISLLEKSILSDLIIACLLVKLA